jgi:hypothetical protein
VAAVVVASSHGLSILPHKIEYKKVSLTAVELDGQQFVLQPGWLTVVMAGSRSHIRE